MFWSKDSDFLHGLPDRTVLLLEPCSPRSGASAVLTTLAGRRDISKPIHPYRPRR
jgi:hypothetical protein